MESFFQSFALVFAGEMGDKTQLLALLLVARYRKPWTIMAGVLVATLLNHALAASFGGWVSSFLTPVQLRWGLALTFFAFALWILVPDREGEFRDSGHFGAFLTTVWAFFLAEMGDKTQLATIALGARFEELWIVTAGTTLGMMGANGLAVAFGQKLMTAFPIQWVRRVASGLFFLSGLGILLS